MLTPKQERLVKRAARKAENRAAFEAYVTGQVAGHHYDDATVKHIVDEGLALIKHAKKLLRTVEFSDVLLRLNVTDALDVLDRDRK
jgi:hypothetical protein